MKKFLVLVLLFFDLHAFSQKTAVYVDPEYHYQIALDLLAKQKYGAAQKEFYEVQNSNSNISYAVRGNSSFYIAKCAAELFNGDAEYLLITFINNYPANENYQDALYELGSYYYRLKRYKNAIQWYSQIDQSIASSEQNDEVNFKMGYSYYMTNDYDKAGKAFAAMKDGNSKYASAAQYYFAHISYVNENYETALQSFLKLKDSESFGPVVPYYITQIYYKQGKFDEVLKYGSGVLDTSTTKNGLEIARMVGESYYRKDKYKEALPYLLDYEKNSAGAGRADSYSIGFSYYRTGEYEKAIPYFQKVIKTDDSLSQNAYYHLADCYLHAKNKSSARNAFQSAAKNSFDKTIQEESQFNYAKLSYELSYQSVAIEAFRNFLKNFPASTYTIQANELLINIYANTHNYKDALAALDLINDKNQNLKTAFQKVAYYRGLELFMDNNSEEAIKLFKESMTYSIEPSLIAESNYWTGEAQYKMNEFDEAVKSYNNFLLTPAALKSEHYNTANYNIGYAYFKNQEYANAQTSFRKYIQDKSQTDKQRYPDALLRIGDSFFMLKDQGNAVDYYNQALAANSKAGDYALYQKGIIQGVQGKMDDKVVTLQKLLDKYPKSVYYDDALYGAGQASLISDHYEDAAKYFRKIISDFPTSIYSRKAELGEALVFYNSKQDERALTSYKKIVQKYPGTDESREALMQIKNISVSQNKVDDYLAYAKNIPNSDMSSSDEDSLTYEAAELRYTQGNCSGAVQDFDKYLNRFPNAIFKLGATYLKSDCLFRDKKYTDALSGYEYVINEPVNNYTEKSLLNAAVINYNLKAYDKSLVDFEKLEEITKSKDNIIASLSGQLRSNYKLNDCDKSISSAKKILDAQISDKDLINEARLISGRCYVQKEDYTNGKAELGVVAKRTNSEMTAESKYLLALIENKLTNYKESQKLIFEIQKQVPSYDYWIAKAFILLGDDYLAQKDTFQAKETYKSILENYESNPTDPDNLKTIAKDKFDSMNASDQSNIKKPENAASDSTEVEAGNK